MPIRAEGKAHRDAGESSLQGALYRARAAREANLIPAVIYETPPVPQRQGCYEVQQEAGLRIQGLNCAAPVILQVQLQCFSLTELLH